MASDSARRTSMFCTARVGQVEAVVGRFRSRDRSLPHRASAFSASSWFSGNVVGDVDLARLIALELGRDIFGDVIFDEGSIFTLAASQ
jgi:hypothetical protein